ncbi:MAG: hypothetical protein A2Z14_10015 [Chloroflexi bacterium RBG_16_48_8]|nr:MAG: hypothetical protein A2Z14_10015 [Chloroflexi bacterium RBG_16_48_8]
MTPENSSLLGYIFIIGGIAMAILAYAIYLNLREDKSSLELVDGDYDIERAGALPLEDSTSLDPPIIETPFSSDMDRPSPLLEEMETETLSKHLTDDNIGVDMPQKKNLVAVVTILREIDSGNLILQIGETKYTSFDDLKDSSHLPRMMRLSSDLNNWLQSTPKKEAGVERIAHQFKLKETNAFSPRSMVEEINEILERRLREEPRGRRAIKLVEMLDGGVNVYIGVDSYPMDEVPFEDVRQLIRQAVAEWEQRR